MNKGTPMTFSSLCKTALLTAMMAAMPLAYSTAQAAPVTLNVGMAASDLGTLDPHRGAATQEKIVLAWIYNGLTRFAPGSTSLETIEGDLAESWEASDDRKVWTFRL